MVRKDVAVMKEREERERDIQEIKKVLDMNADIVERIFKMVIALTEQMGIITNLLSKERELVNETKELEEKVAELKAKEDDLREQQQRLREMTKEDLQAMYR